MEHGAYTPAANRGFTLIEIVITIVILGTVAGILVPFFNAIVHSPDPVIRERAISLGQAMMDEIMAKKWDKNTPMGGGPVITNETLADDLTACTTPPTSCTGNRLNCFICRNPGYTPGTASDINPVYNAAGRVDFDAVDDYNGLVETNTFTDQNGQPTTLTDYKREVVVEYIPSSSDPITHDLPVGSLVAHTDTKRVVVTITSPLGEKFYFVAVACNI
ncbi:MAG: type II secretion system protein [Deltaproteobacteria bacterium]|nr:type II secretion system protein [Deltaproteobacteria bacterium]